MRYVKWAGTVLAGLVVVVVGAVFFLESKAEARIARTWTIDVADIPIPFPLTAEEIGRLQPADGADLDAIAMQRAMERGRRYVQSRAPCVDCHAEDLGGKIIVENPALGRLVAPNITAGGVTGNYTSADWVRIIRHGVRPDNTAALMPAQDFTNLSDEEISDIVAYIKSVPPVARQMPPIVIGPVLATLITANEWPISAERIDHVARRPVYPPAMVTSLELGAHLASVCTGCHGQKLTGGPVAGGDPSWPPAANLMPDRSGLAGWSLADFRKALREGIRPDGRKLDAAMPVSFTSQFEDTEIESLYDYLKTVPPAPTASR
jgi:mono/diheme cytochrome c family protein